MDRTKLALACMGLFSTGAALAYTMGIYDHGLLVPGARHAGVGDTTAVGLVGHGCTADGFPFDVYWTFFDENSNHVTDGRFQMSEKDVYPFVWAAESGLGLEGRTGYLVFTADTDLDGALTPADVPCLAGEAFHVTAADADVAYLPVWPIAYADYNAGAGVPDLTRMDAGTIGNLSAGAPIGDTLLMRYATAAGDSTGIVIWSANDIDGTYTVNLYDDEENRRSVNFTLPNTEQNVIDPASIPGTPAGFVNGFIEWTTPDPGTPLNGVVSYSVIHAQAFSARQTVVNPHHPPAAAAPP
ncbi:MAG TPA: hypothetical protein ENK62_10005 [Chromatiales bacterium]|nr:hypothetical protein [Chromatiales bacterium]